MFTKFKYVAEGRYIRDEKAPIVRAKVACTAVRSERGACTAESVSASMGGAGTVLGCAECCVVRSSYPVAVGKWRRQ